MQEIQTEKNMFTKRDLIESLKNQLAIEYNCAREAFDSSENILTVSKNLPGRRQYIKDSFFFKMATFGQNAVISADERLHPFLLEYIKEKNGHFLFEHHNLRGIEEELNRYGKKLWQTHHMYLPATQITPVSELAPVKWFETEDIFPLYNDKQFSNALCSRFLPERPDMLAVAAYNGDEIIGLAGCSADTPILWQIGIDVNREYRGRGIGTYLVTLLKNEIIKRGKIPFYGTSLTNLYSQNIALNSGFFPAWVEIATIEDKT